MEFGKSKSIGLVQKKIFLHLQQEKLYFHTFDGTVNHFNCTTTGFFVNLSPGAFNLKELREYDNINILEYFVYKKDAYKLEIEEYNVPKHLQSVQVYRKCTETHLGKRGERILTDAICIDVSFSFRGLFRKIISAV